MPGLFSCLQLLESASDEDKEMNDGYHSIVKKLVVCPHCFDDPTVSLDKCLLGLGRGLSSNISTHFGKYHPEVVEDTASVATDPTQQPISMYSGTMVSKQDARVMFHQSIYKFVNDCGFPASTVEKESFRDLLKCAIANAPKLKEKDCSISNKAITRMRLESYNDFLKTVTELGENVRQAYHDLCNKPIAFSTITHDIWQGNDKDVLGVCLMFTDPRNCKSYRLPIGLCSTKGHTAKQVADHTSSILNAVGFTQQDLSASVNDNTNSAVLAGKYIVGNKTGGKCDMHRAELILKHSTGLAVRKKKGEVVDSNEEFMTVYRKFFKFAAWMMSSRAKRFEKLRSYALKHGRKVIKVSMPNTTRVGGCIITFHDLFRNKFVTDMYAKEKFEYKDDEFIKHYPSEEDWQLLAKFEGILAPLKQVSMSLQVDDPSASACSLLEIFTSKHCVEVMKDKGVPVLTVTGPNARPWDASLTIAKLQSYRDIVTYDKLSEKSQLLIERVLVEYTNYIEEGHDSHAEHAMCGHPFLASYGPNILKTIKVYDDESLKRIQKEFVMDIVRKFSQPKKNGTNPQSKSNQQEREQQKESTPVEIIEDEEEESSVPKAVSNVMDCFNIFKTHCITKEKENAALMEATATSTSTDDQVDRAKLYKMCDEQFGRYLEFCENVVHGSWEDLIRQYPTAAFLKLSGSWNPEKQQEFKLACTEHYFHVVGKYFDVLKWWSDNKMLFPKLFPSALIWISKPATNAFQERVFSRSSFMDRNPLMRRQLDKNFEMRTMESITREVRSEIVKNEKLLKQGATSDEKKAASGRQAKKVIDLSQECKGEEVSQVQQTAQQRTPAAGTQVPVVPLEKATPTQSDMTRMETVLRATSKLELYELSGTIGAHGIDAETSYKFKSVKKVDKKTVVSDATWDDVELVDLVDDPRDEDQLEALDRKVVAPYDDDEDKEDSVTALKEAIQERKNELIQQTALEKTVASLPVANANEGTKGDSGKRKASSTIQKGRKRTKQNSLSEALARTVVRTPRKKDNRKPPPTPNDSPTRRSSRLAEKEVSSADNDGTS